MSKHFNPEWDNIFLPTLFNTPYDADDFNKKSFEYTLAWGGVLDCWFNTND